MKRLLSPTFQLSLTLLVITFIINPLSMNAQSLKPASSGYVPSNGVNVYYEVYGEGRPLVLLHGAFMTIGLNWGEMIPELAKTRKVIAIEMQGHGHTAFSERKLDFPTMAGDVINVLNQLKVDSADITGYSMGGYIAYQLAIKYPARVSSLVIISSTYKSTGWLPEVTTAFKNMKPEYFDNSPLQTGYDAVAPNKSDWAKFLLHMFKFIAIPFDLGEANIARIKVPVLLIAGDNDGLDQIELVKTFKLFGGGIPGDMAPMPASQLAILPAKSHVTVMMQTAALLEYMKGFLK